MQLRRVTDPHDPAIEAFGHLQDRVYFEPDMLIPARYIAMMLAQTGGDRENVLLVAEQGDRLVGGTVFHFLPEAGSGFSSFLGIDPAARGQGLARQLHAARWQALQDVSGGTCAALFIDVVHPARESEEQRDAERRAGSDAVGRRARFHALGFRTVNVAYRQPVGGPDGGPVTDMDLLAFVPGDPPTLPAALVADTMRAYWTPWLGRERAEREAARLLGAGGEVDLRPAWAEPDPQP